MKILTLDIETSPHESYTWGMWQQNIAPGQLKTPTEMLSWSAKWYDAPVMTPIVSIYTEADHHTKLHDLLNEADMIVGYNQEKFDMRHINREFAVRQMMPTRPVPQVDLLKVVKQRFNFPHNRLDYVASVLLGEKKLETGGFDLWPAFMEGDPKAVKIMMKYNQHDVRITEKLYTFLRPWIRNHPYMIEIEEDLGDYNHVYQCPVCTSLDTHQRKARRTRCFAIRQIECMKCGAWFEGKRRKLQ